METLECMHKVSKDLKGLKVQLAQRERLAHRVNKAPLVRKESKDHRVTLVLQVHKDQQDLPTR